MDITDGLKASADRLDAALTKFCVAVKGDVEGHEFHGNQWSGGGGSSGGKESYSDRIEGTQKEADREVVRADKAVTKARQELEDFKAKVNVEVAAKVLQHFEDKLAEIHHRQAELMREQEAGKARMKILKEKLASFKKPPSKREVGEDLEMQADKEIAAMNGVVKGLSALTADAESLADEIRKAG
jgi:predicted RNase H-like nuclease (RuvC/YqgF family)